MKENSKNNLASAPIGQHAEILVEQNMIFLEDIVKRACDFATIMHQGQMRKDGKTPYINHPIKTAEYVSQIENLPYKKELVAAAYLHDTIENTEATITDIENHFGSFIASLVNELTSNKQLQDLIGKTTYLKLKMRDMSDLALVVKLCDRLANVSDLINAEEDFRRKYQKETIEIITFIIYNRSLNKIHIMLIQKIAKQLSTLEKLYPINNSQLNKLLCRIHP